LADDFAHVCTRHYQHLDSEPLFAQMSAKVGAIQPGHLRIISLAIPSAVSAAGLIATRKLLPHRGLLIE
jgi:hypothetical protein